MRLRCRSKGCRNKGLTEGFCTIHNHQRPSVRYQTLVRHSKKRNLKVTLKKEDYFALISDSICRYCDGELNKTGASLDRLNNKLGYSLKNVVPCCSNCNNLRGNLLTEIETVEVIELLKELRGNKQQVWGQTRKGKRRKHGFSRS